MTITAKTAEKLRNGELEFEDLSAPLPSGDLTPEHAASYAEHKGLESRAQKLIYGICAGEKSNGSVGRVTSQGNRERLKEEYGVDYDSLAEEARQWVPELDADRALEMLDGHEGDIATRSRDDWQERAENETHTETVNTSDEFAERLDNYCEKHDLDYDDLTIIPNDSADLLKRLDSEMQEHDLDGEDLCVARHDDVKAIKSERDRLIGRVGIDREDAESLSLDSLRKIAEKDPGGADTRPAPRSGDVLDDDDDLARYSDRERAADLKSRIEHLETHAGDSNELARRQIEMYQSELEDMA